MNFLHTFQFWSHASKLLKLVYTCTSHVVHTGGVLLHCVIGNLEAFFIICTFWGYHSVLFIKTFTIYNIHQRNIRHSQIQVCTNWLSSIHHHCRLKPTATPTLMGYQCSVQCTTVTVSSLTFRGWVSSVWPSHYSSSTYHYCLPSVSRPWTDLKIREHQLLQLRTYTSKRTLPCTYTEEDLSRKQAAGLVTLLS